MTATPSLEPSGSAGSDSTRTALDLFERHRRRLRALAYRMLGSVADAEDVVQDCYLRWHSVDPATVEAPEHFLTAMAARLAIDHLRSARVKREFYVGEWLPEPLVEGWADGPDSALEAEGDLSMAFLLLLERLPPDQRAVYVLREAMDLGFEEIGGMLDKSAMACRQAYKRARERIGGPPRYDADRSRSQAIARAFQAATAQGSYDGLLALLADAAVLVGDGGGKARAAINPIHGADRIARFLLGVLGKGDRRLDLLTPAINGQPGFVLWVDDRFYSVVSLDIRDGRVAALYQIANPDKLDHARRAVATDCLT